MAGAVAFEYKRALTPIGFVWIPVARVELEYGRRRLQLDMTVDSGADLTMIRYQIGVQLGMRRERSALTTLSGVGGGIPYVLRSATMRIGPLTLVGRVAWAQRDDVPLLLGRVDVLERLVATLNGPRRRVILRQVRRQP
jgi:hypothetical protein